MLREVARLVHQHVRRTDLLGTLDSDTLLVLAPGLDSRGGRHMVHRLRKLLGSRVDVEIGARHGNASRISQKGYFGAFR
jgi:PleD family two-component response regulator